MHAAVAGDEHDRAYNHVCFVADDIHEAVKRIEDAGYTLRKAPKVGIDGNWQAWVRDPDGRWYYLAAEGDGTELSKAGQTGAMVTGWLTDPSDGHRYYLDLASGAMVTGEKAMNGKKYFFNEYPAGATGWHFDEASQRWHFDGGIVIPMGALLREE